MMFKRRSPKKGFTLIELLTSIFIIATLMAIMVPFLRRNVYKTQFIACKSNLKNISTALQLYNNDNDTRFPVSLDFLTPTYMGVMPKCPSATNTYGYDHIETPESYTIYCNGLNHGILDVPVNQPFWSSSSGLSE